MDGLVECGECSSCYLIFNSSNDTGMSYCYCCLACVCVHCLNILLCSLLTALPNFAEKIHNVTWERRRRTKWYAYLCFTMR